ncbi:sorting nexin-8 [Sarotherodon galilaeus]
MIALTSRSVVTAWSRLHRLRYKADALQADCNRNSALGVARRKVVSLSVAHPGGGPWRLRGLCGEEVRYPPYNKKIVMNQTSAGHTSSGKDSVNLQVKGECLPAAAAEDDDAEDDDAEDDAEDVDDDDEDE